MGTEALRERLDEALDREFDPIDEHFKKELLDLVMPIIESEQARLREALNTRDLFINPHLLEQAADEIDCGVECENIWREDDVNASGCRCSDRGDYCPNEVAETLRALAKLSRALALAQKNGGAK